MKARLRKKKLKEAWREVVDLAFNQYVEHTVDRLVGLGLDSNVALEAVFTVADYATEQGIMPAFPDDRSTRRECGAWVVAAVDAGFLEFVVDAVKGSGDEAESA